MLNLLIITPILGILVIKYKPKVARVIGMITTILSLYLALFLNLKMNYNNIEYQFRENLFGFTLGIDGISLSLILLTTLIMPILILLKERDNNLEEKEIIIQILLLESFLFLLFSSLDLFLFYIFFELILIPMFLFIGKYGSKEKRIESAYRFLIYSLIGSLILLLSILFL